MTPKEAFVAAVKNQINNDKAHGWGVDDSLAVIKAIFKEETGEELDPIPAGLIRQVINPAAFHAGLAKAGALDAMVPRKQQRENIFSEFSPE